MENSSPGESPLPSSAERGGRATSYGAHPATTTANATRLLRQFSAAQDIPNIDQFRHLTWAPTLLFFWVQVTEDGCFASAVTLICMKGNSGKVDRMLCSSSWSATSNTLMFE